MSQKQKQELQPRPKRNIVLTIGVWMGMIPLTLLIALLIRAIFEPSTWPQMYVVPFTALPAFIVQMIGVYAASRTRTPVSKNDGRMIVTTILFILLALIIVLKSLFG